MKNIHQNKDVPTERQMLYILQHWDEVHKALAEAKETIISLEKKVADTKLLYRAILRQVKNKNKELKRRLASVESYSVPAPENPVPRESLISKLIKLWK